MDPFNQVQEDGEDQVRNLDIFLKNLNDDSVSDNDKTLFESQISELFETIEDLKESVQQIKSEPELYADLTKEEIKRREAVIEKLSKDYSRLNNTWQRKKIANSNNPFISYDDANDNNIHGTVTAGAADEERSIGMNNLQLQQEIQYQDEQLNGVYDSVTRINQQARLMGDELEDQAGLINEFEQDFDRTQGRLNRSSKRLKLILERNKERFSDCCIAALIVVLIVLLVLIIVL